MLSSRKTANHVRSQNGAIMRRNQSNTALFAVFTFVLLLLLGAGAVGGVLFWRMSLAEEARREEARQRMEAIQVQQRQALREAEAAARAEAAHSESLEQAENTSP